MDDFTEIQIKSILEFDCSKLETDKKCDVEEIVISSDEERTVDSNVAIDDTSNEKHSFKCNICDFTAHYVPNYDIAYQNHMRTHGAMGIYDNLPVPCTECDFRCKTHVELSKHMIAHKSMQLYLCSDCGYKNLCEKQFNNHTKKLFHKIKCLKCDAKFVNLFAMKIHMTDHITLHCHECKRKIVFNTKDELDKHMTKHMENSTFSCKFCEKSFQHTSHLKLHLLSHKGKGKSSRQWPRTSI